MILANPFFSRFMKNTDFFRHPLISLPFLSFYLPDYLYEDLSIQVFKYRLRIKEKPLFLLDRIAKTQILLA